MMLIDQFEKRATEAPERSFIHFVADDPVGDVCLSYGETDRRASAFARLLKDKGIVKGDTVAFLMPNSAE